MLNIYVYINALDLKVYYTASTTQMYIIIYVNAFMYFRGTHSKTKK